MKPGGSKLAAKPPAGYVSQSRATLRTQLCFSPQAGRARRAPDPCRAYAGRRARPRSDSRGARTDPALPEPLARFRGPLLVSAASGTQIESAPMATMGKRDPPRRDRWDRSLAGAASPPARLPLRPECLLRICKHPCPSLARRRSPGAACRESCACLAMHLGQLAHSQAAGAVALARGACDSR